MKPDKQRAALPDYIDCCTKELQSGYFLPLRRNHHVCTIVIDCSAAHRYVLVVYAVAIDPSVRVWM